MRSAGAGVVDLDWAGGVYVLACIKATKSEDGEWGVSSGSSVSTQALTRYVCGYWYAACLVAPYILFSETMP